MKLRVAPAGVDPDIDPVVGLVEACQQAAVALKDQNDQDVSLEALLKKGPVAVVFIRSADWCLYCKLQMVQLQRNLKEFEAAGGQVVGISYDSTKLLKSFAKRTTITFPLLSDAGSKTIDAFDIRDKESPKGNSYHGTRMNLRRTVSNGSRRRTR